MATNPSENFEPFLLLSEQAEELAIWHLADGKAALAMFHSADAATSYKKLCNLGEDWQIIQPGKSQLLELLHACVNNAITVAVLDPDDKQAKKAFDLHAVIKATEQ